MKNTISQFGKTSPGVKGLRTINGKNSFEQRNEQHTSDHNNEDAASETPKYRPHHRRHSLDDNGGGYMGL